MAISQAMCTSFKKELLEGVHNFKNSGGSTFQIALYTSSARTLHARLTPLANDLATAATTVTYLVQFLHMGTTPDQ